MPIIEEKLKKRFFEIYENIDKCLIVVIGGKNGILYKRQYSLKEYEKIVSKLWKVVYSRTIKEYFFNKIEIKKIIPIENLSMENLVITQYAFPNSNWNDFLSTKSFFLYKKKESLYKEYKVYLRKNCMFRKKGSHDIISGLIKNVIVDDSLKVYIKVDYLNQFEQTKSKIFPIDSPDIEIISHTIVSN